MTSLNLDTTATVPTGTSLSVTVYEDTSGDGNADNSATQSIDDGTNTYTLSGFDGSSGNDVWLDVNPDNTDETAAASLDSATVTVAGQVINASVATLTAQSPNPSVSPGSLSIDASVAELTAQAPNPSVSGTGTVTVAASVAALTAQSPNPSVVTGAATIEASVAELTAQSPNPSVTAGAATIQASVAELVAQSPNPTVFIVRQAGSTLRTTNSNALETNGSGVLQTK